MGEEGREGEEASSERGKEGVKNRREGGRGEVEKITFTLKFAIVRLRKLHLVFQVLSLFQKVNRKGQDWKSQLINKQMREEKKSKYCVSYIKTCYFDVG